MWSEDGSSNRFPQSLDKQATRSSVFTKTTYSLSLAKITTAEHTTLIHLELLLGPDSAISAVHDGQNPHSYCQNMLLRSTRALYIPIASNLRLTLTTSHNGRVCVAIYCGRLVIDSLSTLVKNYPSSFDVILQRCPAGDDDSSELVRLPWTASLSNRIRSYSRDAQLHM